uniref:Neurotensin/neuromedin N n=1 Tax=Xiphophorus maculatus TaxID=8083 RepID=A0A3B5QFW5_XIPMA
MQAQLACVLLLCFPCGALCTGKQQNPFPVLLRLLQIKHNRQTAPYWQVSLTNLCRLVGGLRQEAWSGEQEDEEEAEASELREGSLPQREELYSLQHICRLLRDSVEYSEENGDAPLKRKSPYILKRQVAHNAKSRRPYILKRSSVY